jgi:hypothetical protein
MVEEGKADCVAEILFNESLFGDATVNRVSRIIVRGVNSHDFSAIALLQTID